jgi:hypothetical protein
LPRNGTDIAGHNQVVLGQPIGEGSCSTTTRSYDRVRGAVGTEGWPHHGHPSIIISLATTLQGKSLIMATRSIVAEDPVRDHARTLRVTTPKLRLDPPFRCTD